MSIPTSLRPLTDTDITPEYVAWLNDPEVTRWMGTHEATLESQQQWFSKWTGREDAKLFAICCWEVECHGQMVGTLKLECLRSESGEEYGTLALMIGHKTHWMHGGGHGEQAIRLGTTLAFHLWPAITHVAAAIKAQNFGSLKAFERAGYTVEWPEKLWARVRRT